MVSWHLTLKLFPAKCHEQATLRKLWHQTGNSSLLPAKCWPLLHVIAEISVLSSNFAFALFCYITNHLMTGPLGNSEFCSGDKIHCSHRDQSCIAEWKKKRQVLGVLVLTISCEKALQNILNATDYQLPKLAREQQCGIKICITTATNRWECRIFSRPGSVEILEYKMW